MRALPDDRPLAIAHRGGNTLDKLEAAVAAGVDYLETDLWFRRGRLEVRHDRTSGPLPFLYDRWSLRPNVWRQLVLEPVLEAAKDRCRLFLDLKGDASELADAPPPPSAGRAWPMPSRSAVIGPTWTACANCCRRRRCFTRPAASGWSSASGRA